MQKQLSEKKMLNEKQIEEVIEAVKANLPHYDENAIEEIKRTEEYKYAETMGNENSNGNSLYLIIMQWAGQKK
jgi:hypothetical protein